MIIQAHQLPGFRTRKTRDLSLPSADQVAQALACDATARRIVSAAHPIEHGMLCGSRLNLNVLKSTGVAVNTVHSATNQGKNNGGYKANKGFYRGRVLTYMPTTALTQAYFNVDQKARERIATRQASKHPMASVDGFLDLDAPNFDGVEFRFNPMRCRLFMDADGRAIHWAEHATVVGHSVFVRGAIALYTPQSAPSPAGDAPCAITFAGLERRAA